MEKKHWLYLGRLRITNVVKNDEQEGKAYSCMALNYFMRDNAIGPEHQINVIGCKCILKSLD